MLNLALKKFGFEKRKNYTNNNHDFCGNFFPAKPHHFDVKNYAQAKCFRPLKNRQEEKSEEFCKFGLDF